MSNRYTGTVTLDDIDMPAFDGIIRVVGEVKIRVTVDVDPGCWRDANGDGCPPCEMERDYEIEQCDLVVCCYDSPVRQWKDWNNVSPKFQSMLRDKYLDAACEACECGEECE